MAFSAEIVARLGLKTEAFNKELQQAGIQVTRFGQQTGRTLERTFSAGNIVKGFMSGLGIGSALSIFNTLTKAIGDSIAHAGKLADKFSEISGNARAAAESVARIGKSEAEVIDMLDAKLVKLKQTRQDLMNDTGPKSFFGGLIQRGSALDKLFGFSRDAELERAEQIKLANKEIGQAIVERKQLEQGQSKKGAAEDSKAADEYAREMREREAALGNLADFERAARREKMTDEELLVDLQREQADVKKKIGEYEKFQREGGELTADGAKELLDLKKQQVVVEKDIVAVTDRKVKGEQAIGKEVESNIAKWKDFKGTIESTGRGDSELSDAELKRKEQQTRSDIAAREIAQNQSGGLFIGNGVKNTDMFLSAQKYNLEQLMAERRLREETRRNASFFGEERAFQMSGLSESRFRQILSDSVDQQQRLNDTLQRLERNVQRIPEAIKAATEN